jgi:hypothetical protein
MLTSELCSRSAAFYSKHFSLKWVFFFQDLAKPMFLITLTIEWHDHVKLCVLWGNIHSLEWRQSCCFLIILTYRHHMNIAYWVYEGFLLSVYMKTIKASEVCTWFPSVNTHDKRSVIPTLSLTLSPPKDHPNQIQLKAVITASINLNVSVLRAPPSTAFVFTNPAHHRYTYTLRYTCTQIYSH